MKNILFCASAVFAALFGGLEAHCQMPCGIYHDDMVYDQIDQYVETMVKAIAKIKDNKASTPQERNEVIRWVMTKDKLSDETAELILTYFLQQKIKPGEPDTPKRIAAAHRLLFDLVAIKQTADFKTLSDFAEEWEAFKLMFHIEGYECEMEKKNLKIWDEKRKEYEEKAKQEEDNSNASGNSKASPSLTTGTSQSAKGGKAGALQNSSK